MADVAATLAALDVLSARFDAVMPEIVAEIAHTMQVAIMANAPVGTPGNSTNMPGDLRRSIQVDGPTPVGAHGWEARVGPTTVYGRQRELGGDIYPTTKKVMAFTKFGERIFTRHVYQKPDPYTKTGYDESEGSVSLIVYEQLAAVIESV